MLQVLLSRSSQGPHLAPPRLRLLTWQGWAPRCGTAPGCPCPLPTHCAEAAPRGLTAANMGHTGDCSTDVNAAAPSPQTRAEANPACSSSMLQGCPASTHRMLQRGAESHRQGKAGRGQIPMRGEWHEERNNLVSKPRPNPPKRACPLFLITFSLGSPAQGVEYKAAHRGSE